jgi:acetyl-CoA synthetase
MALDRIVKQPPSDGSGWNLTDYAAARAQFSWQAVRAELFGNDPDRVNIAALALDRQVDQGRGEVLAMRWLGKDGSVRDFTYADLMAEAARFADVLASLGIVPGDRVFCLSNRLPDLYVAALGTLRHGAVFSPLFSAFGPGPVSVRVSSGDGRALVTTSALYKRKVAPVRDQLPTLERVLLIDGDEAGELPEGTLALGPLMRAASSERPAAGTGPEDPALLHFTSGTTGKPKGALHVHSAVQEHFITGRYALDLHPNDVFWCTADPGWVTGTSYGIIAPLVNGCTMIVDEQEFDAARWYSILQDHGVTVWYTAPTAIRMLMKVGSDIAQGYDLSRLRFMASVGEPLNPEGVVWGQETFGMPFHDNWWQTETGGIMIANYGSMDVKPGSMGRPMPGVEAEVMVHAADGTLTPAPDNTPGELCLKRGWPSMFREYIHNPERYAKAFQDGWYKSGDLAQRDADGYFWFVGRDDDMIKSAGHLIGPFEVESALVEHSAVAEAAVIGIPEETAGEVVKAFVALKHGYTGDEALAKALLGHARKRLGPAVAPKQIEFRDNLPKTRSGKIMRRLLKARELGLPEGDTSTLESDES